MTKTEFEKKRQKLFKKHQNEHRGLATEYCTFLVEELGIKPGDSIKDCISGEVGKYLWWKLSHLIEPIFVCEWLKKDGTPRDKYEEICIYYSLFSKEHLK